MPVAPHTKNVESISGGSPSEMPYVADQASPSFGRGISRDGSDGVPQPRRTLGHPDEDPLTVTWDPSRTTCSTVTEHVCACTLPESAKSTWATTIATLRVRAQSRPGSFIVLAFVLQPTR